MRSRPTSTNHSRIQHTAERKRVHLWTQLAEASKAAQDDSCFWGWIFGGEIHAVPPLNQKAIQGWGTGPVIQPERQKFGNGPVGVRGLPGPQMRGTRGTHLQWRDSLPWDLGHPPRNHKKHSSAAKAALIMLALCG